MPLTVIVHVANEEAFLAEIEAIPDVNANVLFFTNPRRRDGKPISQFDAEADRFMFPWHRINYLEIMAERQSRDELVEFFRDE